MRIQIEMPKRKADQSVDEWLKEGIAASESSRTISATNCNHERSQPTSTVEGQLTSNVVDLNSRTSSTSATPHYGIPLKSEVVAADVTPAQSEVAKENVEMTVQGTASEEEAAEWFWALLAQSGYERW